QQAEVCFRLDLSYERQRCARPDQVDPHQQRKKHADEYSSQRQKVILKADHFVIETEDPLANETLRCCVNVRQVASEFPVSHIIVSPPPVLPAIYRIPLG